MNATKTEMNLHDKVLALRVLEVLRKEVSEARRKYFDNEDMFGTERADELKKRAEKRLNQHKAKMRTMGMSV